MFEKLKARWKVNTLNLVLVIATFALGGSLCGYLGRKLLLLTGLEKGAVWVTLYIILVTLLWPLCVLAISIPLGQFSFFRNYITKIWKKMTGRKLENNNGKVKLAVFASGAGSNAKKIISNLVNGQVSLVVCNKPGAAVITIAAAHGIPVLMVEKEKFFSGDHYLPELSEHKIDFIVLAGFLWKLPAPLIQAFPKKIVNIHPALLPKFGGKGMYGKNVHEAVIAAGEKESGISIHYVDELYDHGEIIFQAHCDVDEKDNSETLAQKIHALEHMHYPAVINRLLEK